MKYCVRYSRKFNYIDKVDEFKIVYKPNHEKLLAFLELYSKKRIIISFTVDDIQEIVLSKCLEKYTSLENKNFAFLLPPINEENKVIISLFIKELKKSNIEYFFNEKLYSIDKVWEIISLGVSDVYICGELGFELKSISKRIHDAGVKIRIHPDVAQSTAVSVDPLTKFFVRPEDIYKYNDYVDVCEFFAEDKIRDNLLYSVYAKEHRWYLNLNDIILGLDCEPVSNISISKQFGTVRLNCRKRCMREGGCAICTRCIELSRKLEEKGLVLKEREVSKEEYESNEDNYN